MTFDEFIEKLIKDGEYNCVCFIVAPCGFCENIGELYEEWCTDNEQEPIY